MRTLVLVNTLTAVNSSVYSNHIALWTHLKAAYPKNEFILYTPERSSIDNARNNAAKMALNLGCDYLLFIDDDVLVHPSSVKKLIDADQDIIAGLVIIRGYPFNLMIFRDTEGKQDGKLVKGLDFWKAEDIEVDDDGKPVPKVIQCGAVGFSLCLIKTSILKVVKPPFFVTGTFNTEDVYFCEKYRVAMNNRGETPSIAFHTGVLPGHILPGEAVEFQTRQKFLDFYKPLVNENNAKKINRNLLYVEGALKNIEKVSV